MAERVFKVIVEMPKGVTSDEMADYILKAITNWTGGMDPEHPLGCVDIKAAVLYNTSGMQFQVDNHASNQRGDSR